MKGKIHHIFIIIATLFTGVAIIVIISSIFKSNNYGYGYIKFVIDEIVNGTKLKKQYTVYGIDISNYQGNIEWNNLAIKLTDSDNTTNTDNYKYSIPVQFIIMKATEGSSIVDIHYKTNSINSERYGYIVGAYHVFSSLSSPRTQAEAYIKIAKLTKSDLPPILDIETTGILPEAEFRHNVLIWLNLVEEHYNVTPIIYSSTNIRKRVLNTREFNKYKFWIAHYYTDMPNTENWIMWQFSNNARISGIEGNVDIDIFNGDIADLKKYIHDCWNSKND